jgi:hypothetical protein
LLVPRFAPLALGARLRRAIGRHSGERCYSTVSERRGQAAPLPAGKPAAMVATWRFVK